MTSLICSPQDGASLERDEELVSVRGVAWSGGGREVIRVDVSSDGGKTWNTATVNSEEQQPLGRAWAWKLWEVRTVDSPYICIIIIIISESPPIRWSCPSHLLVMYSCVVKQLTCLITYNQILLDRYGILEVVYQTLGTE